MNIPPARLCGGLASAPVLEVAILAMRQGWDGRGVGAVLISPIGGDGAARVARDVRRCVVVGARLLRHRRRGQQRGYTRNRQNRFHGNLPFRTSGGGGVLSASRPLTNEHSSCCPLAKFVHRQSCAFARRVMPAERPLSVDLGAALSGTAAGGSFGDSQWCADALRARGQEALYTAVVMFRESGGFGPQPIAKANDLWERGGFRQAKKVIGECSRR